MKTKTVFALVIFCFLINKQSFSQFTWIPSTLPDSIKTYSIAFDTSGKQFIATDYGVYSSLDGVIWERTSMTEFKSIVYINSNNTIYAGLQKLHRSYDGGNTWDSIFYYSQGGITSLHTQGDSCVFLGTWGGLFRTVDSANTWTQPIVTNVTEFISSINSNSNGRLFAGSISSHIPSIGLYRTDNNGQSWYSSNLDHHFVSSIVINSNDDIFVGTRGHYYDGTGLILKSIDDGDNWNVILDNNYIASMDINNYDELSFGNMYGSSGGIYFSHSGIQWANITYNIQSPYFKHVVFNPSDQLFVITELDRRIFFTETMVNIPNETSSKRELVKLFPNPAINEVIIKSGLCNISDINITDIYGIDQNNIVNIVYLDDIILISISRLCKGAYFINYSCDNKNQSKILIKY